ncbi:MAG: LSU ribosomal protein L21E, partial [uncultured archaeon A07HN63]
HARQALERPPRWRHLTATAVGRIFETGQKVHLDIDPSVSEGRFHPRFNGHTGEVTGTQGSAYTVSIVDGGKEKTVIARPAHLHAQQ